jgi:hypothetical protein
LIDRAACADDLIALLAGAAATVAATENALTFATSVRVGRASGMVLTADAFALAANLPFEAIHRLALPGDARHRAGAFHGRAIVIFAASACRETRAGARAIDVRGGATELFAVADAVATGVVAAFGLPNRTAIRSALGRAAWTLTDAIHRCLDTRTTDRRWGGSLPPGSVDAVVLQRRANDRRATEPEQALEH